MSPDDRDPPDPTTFQVHLPVNDTEPAPAFGTVGFSVLDETSPVSPRGLAQRYMSDALNRLVDAVAHAESVAMAIAAGLDASVQEGP